MGEINYKLVIEGAPVAWSTSTGLECIMADGRVVYAGLQYEGMKIKEELSPLDSKVNVGGMTFCIRHQKAVSEFARYPHVIGDFIATIESDGTVDTETVELGTAPEYPSGLDFLYAGRVVTLDQRRF